MIKNYLKIALRNIARSPLYSTINILGLALGMAIVLLIGAWITDELNYNKGTANHERVAMVMHNSVHGGRTDTRRADPYPLAADLRTHYAGDFDQVALCSFFDGHSLQTGNNQPQTSVGIYAQPGFPDILSLEIVSGSKDLTDPSSMLLSKSTATALFGNENPIGHALLVDGKGLLSVSGVYADLPENSDWQALNYVMNWSYFEASQQWVRGNASEWNGNSFMILTLLKPGADMAKTSEKIKAALQGHNRNDKPSVFLHPMDRWHLYGEFKDGYNTGGAVTYIYMFGSIGIFVLILACINFMNLSTARSEKRAKEVGIRKTVGSLRSQLIGQFLSESTLLALIAAGLALGLARIGIPWFSNLAQSPIHLPLTPTFLSLYIAFTIAVGLLAGSYPALYLSSFNVIQVLKGTIKAGPNTALPRKILSTLQFTVSITLIIGTIVVFTQIVHVRNRPTGYDRDNVLLVRMNTDDLSKHFEAISAELKQSGAVSDMTQSTNTVPGNPWQQSGFSWTGKDPNITPLFDVVFTTTEFGKTVNWQIVKGRDFSREFLTDSTAIVVNEAAVQYMALKDPIGATVNYLYSSRKDNRYRIIGVVKDMVLDDPGQKVHPAIFMIDTSNSAWIMLKVNSNMPTEAAMPIITKVFQRYNPSSPFDYQYASDRYAQKFKSEDRVLRLAVFFTAFAILISCLGLFGLASFMAEQRIREIGVRKVLGATVPQLWMLLSKDFVRLTALSWIIALPISWLGMNKWLQSYDYRTTISVWIFVGTLAGALLITLMTVSFQSIRASMANPVKSLRTQ